MNQQEKYMDNLENKKGSFLSDLNSKTYQQSMQRNVSDIGNRVEFSENVNNNKESQFQENSNDLYFNDEESMIPKGLLDQPYDKSEEHYFNEVTTSTHNTNMLSYGIPCYIAVFPQPAERQMANYNQINGGSSYFPAEPSYLYHLGNDYILQNQRDMRNFNNPQYNRNYQGMDYNWWNHGRQNHIPYIPNANIEMRSPNIQRNLGVNIPEKFYDPQQIIHEYPYEFHQRDLGYKAHISYGYDNSYLGTNCPQPPFPKIHCRNQTKYRREFQQTQDSTVYLKNAYVHDVHSTVNINHGINPTNVTMPKHEEINKYSSDHESLMSYLNVYNTKYKSNDLNTFKKIALDGCLQLEKLLATNNNKTSGKNLEELCRSVKSQLSYSMNTKQTELIIQELILGFLHICNSWICISSIITMKQDQISPHERNLQTLLVDFENWQNKSKTLLEKLLVTVQEISLEHEHYIKNIYKGAVNSTGSQESEKSESDTGMYIGIQCKTDLMNQDVKQKQLNISTKSAFYNEGFNTKQTLSQMSEAENCVLLKYCEKNENTNAGDGSTESAEFINNQQNFSSMLNQNKSHDLSKTKPQTCDDTQGIFFNINPENINREEKFENNKNKIAQPEKKASNFPLFQKNTSQFKQYIATYITTKHNSSFGLEKDLAYDKENTQKNDSTEQPDIQCTQNAKYETSNLKSDDFVHYRLTVQTKNKDNEEEEKELKNRTNNEVNQNYQVTHDRYNPKYNRKKSLKNKICNFSKNYSKPIENGIYAEKMINIKTYNKSKLHDIFSAIQGADLEKFVTQRISDNDIIKIRQSITYPLFSISYSVNKDCYQNLNDVLDDLYKLFFKAKCENKGNITLLTVANRLELKLINMMFEEIGIC